MLRLTNSVMPPQMQRNRDNPHTALDQQRNAPA